MLKIRYDQGLQLSRDESELGPGELRVATGAFYKSGDSRAHRIGGVTEFGDTGSGKKIDGIGLLRFDSGGTDQLVALSDKTLYGATLSTTGASGTFSTLTSGLGTQAKSLSAAHYADRWYLALGSKNIVVESDGTTREMGMQPPPDALSAAVGVQSGSTATRPNAGDGDFNAEASAYDGDNATFSSADRTTAGSSTSTWTWGTSDSGTDRVLNIRWATSLQVDTGSSVLTELPEGGLDDVGGLLDSGYNIDIKFEVSEDAGDTWTTFYNPQGYVSPQGISNATFNITDSLELSGNLQFRATLKYNSGTAQATLRIMDIVAKKGSTAADFTLDSGLYYAITEYDDTRPYLESPIGAAQYVSATDFDTGNAVTLTIPSTAQNAVTTHFRIYRTTDGGSLPSALGLIGAVPVGTTSFLDTFEDSKDVQSKPLYPLLRTLEQQDAAASNPLYFDVLSPPTSFAVMRVYEGSIVGLSANNPRALYYSVAGFPERFPIINVIDSFPLEDHDELVDCVSLGASLIIAAKGAMMRLTGLPRVVNSVRDNSRVEQIKGAPGCVGRRALTAYSVAGEPRAAWISPAGVYITNGDTIDRISDDIDWSVYDGVDKSDWSLHWDERRLCLILSTGATDGQYFLLHMAPEHRKANGEPKWTGPHYGSYVQFDSGYLDSAHRLYGGHSSNGLVYVLDRRGTSTDASSAYSGTVLPTILETGKIFAEGRNWAVLDARLYHSDFGSGSSCAAAWTVGNDDEDGGEFTLSESLSLSGNRGEQFDVSMRGQWHRVKLTITGAQQGAVRDIEANTKGQSRSGGSRVA